MIPMIPNTTPPAPDRFIAAYRNEFVAALDNVLEAAIEARNAALEARNADADIALDVLLAAVYEARNALDAHEAALVTLVAVYATHHAELDAAELAGEAMYDAAIAALTAKPNACSP